MQSSLRKIVEPLTVVGPAIALVAGPVTGWGRNESLADAMLTTALVVIGITIVLLMIANALERNGDTPDAMRGGA